MHDRNVNIQGPRLLMLLILIGGIAMLVVVSLLTNVGPTSNSLPTVTSALLINAFKRDCACIFDIRLGDESTKAQAKLQNNAWFSSMNPSYVVQGNGIKAMTRLVTVNVTLKENKVTGVELLPDASHQDMTLGSIVTQLGPPTNYVQGHGTYAMLYARVHFLINGNYPEGEPPRLAYAQRLALTDSLPSVLPDSIPQWSGWKQ